MRRGRRRHRRKDLPNIFIHTCIYVLGVELDVCCGRRDSAVAERWGG